MKYTEPHLDRSALVVIDVQNDFTLEGAPAQIPGTLDVVPTIADLLNAYRQHELPIVHIVRLYRDDGGNVDLCRRAMIEGGKRIVAPGSIGSQIPEALRYDGMPELDHERLLAGEVQPLASREVVIYKPRWGAFYGTPLHEHLVSEGVETLVFCGCNFPNCPRTSIYEASERDYRIVLVGDAVSQAYTKGLEELAAIGVCMMSATQATEQITAIKSGQRTPRRRAADC